MRSSLLEKTVSIFETHGFDVLSYFKSAIDIGAKNKRISLLLKVLDNIDGIKAKNAMDLKQVSAATDSFPLVVGTHSKTIELQPNTMYERYGIATLSPHTLENLLNNNFPKNLSINGQLVLNIDAEILQKARLDKGYSRQELAEKIGVTKESIYYYEQGNMRVKQQIANRLETILETKITQQINPLKKPLPHNSINSELARKLKQFDFNVFPVTNLNFNIIGNDKKYRVVISENQKEERKLQEFCDFFSAFLAMLDDTNLKREDILATTSRQDLLRMLH